MSFCGLRPPRGAVTFPRSHSQCGEEPDCHLLSPLLTPVFSAERLKHSPARKRVCFSADTWAV